MRPLAVAGDGVELEGAGAGQGALQEAVLTHVVAVAHGGVGILEGAMASDALRGGVGGFLCGPREYIRVKNNNALE